jgi:hypothetical protein
MILLSKHGRTSSVIKRRQTVRKDNINSFIPVSKSALQNTQRKKKINKTCTKYQKQIYIKSREMSQATYITVHLGSKVEQLLK